MSEVEYNILESSNKLAVALLISQELTKMGSLSHLVVMILNCLVMIFHSKILLFMKCTGYY